MANVIRMSNKDVTGLADALSAEPSSDIDFSDATPASSKAEAGNPKSESHLRGAMFLYSMFQNMTNKPEVRNSFFNVHYWCLLVILNHMLISVQIDWDRVAHKAGYKNVAVAKATFNKIKAKYGALDDEPILPAIASKAANKAPPKPRAKKDKSEKATGSGTNNNASKVTKTRAPKKKSKAAKSEEKAEDSSESMEDVVRTENDVGEKAEAVIDHDGVEALSLDAAESKDENAFIDN